VRVWSASRAQGSHHWVLYGLVSALLLKGTGAHLAALCGLRSVTGRR
jgi:hypothetical protein